MKSEEKKISTSTSADAADIISMDSTKRESKSPQKKKGKGQRKTKKSKKANENESKKPVAPPPPPVAAAAAQGTPPETAEHEITSNVKPAAARKTLRKRKNKTKKQTSKKSTTPRTSEPSGGGTSATARSRRFKKRRQQRMDEEEHSSSDESSEQSSTEFPGAVAVPGRGRGSSNGVPSSQEDNHHRGTAGVGRSGMGSSNRENSIYYDDDGRLLPEEQQEEEVISGDGGLPIAAMLAPTDDIVNAVVVTDNDRNGDDMNDGEVDCCVHCSSCYSCNACCRHSCQLCFNPYPDSRLYAAQYMVLFSFLTSILTAWPLLVISIPPVLILSAVRCSRQMKKNAFVAGIVTCLVASFLSVAYALWYLINGECGSSFIEYFSCSNRYDYKGDDLVVIPTIAFIDAALYAAAAYCSYSFACSGRLEKSVENRSRSNCICNPYSGDIYLRTAQFVIAIAVPLSAMTWWVVLYLSATPFFLLQMVWCGKMEKVGFVVASVLTTICSVLSLYHGIWIVIGKNYYGCHIGDFYKHSTSPSRCYCDDEYCREIKAMIALSYTSAALFAIVAFCLVIFVKYRMDDRSTSNDDQHDANKMTPRPRNKRHDGDEGEEDDDGDSSEEEVEDIEAGGIITNN